MLHSTSTPTKGGKFIQRQIKLIFIWMVVRQDSFWNRGKRSVVPLIVLDPRLSPLFLPEKGERASDQILFGPRSFCLMVQDSIMSMSNFVDTM